ncbi:hypothetical protein ABTH81_22645, partial [Acinetobacter baumannii]
KKKAITRNGGENPDAEEGEQVKRCPACGGTLVSCASSMSSGFQIFFRFLFVALAAQAARIRIFSMFLFDSLNEGKTSTSR